MDAIVKNAHLWRRHPEDFYVEPGWVSWRLFDVEQFKGAIWDPACGIGRIVDSASRNHHYLSFGSDIVKRSDWCENEIDFLSAPVQEWHEIVSNPPFGIADKFIKHALAARKVAMLLPTKWMNSAARGKWLETTPLKQVLLLAPRPSMPPGPVIEAGEKPGNGTVDFAWFVWERGYIGAPTIGWLRRDE
jgi:hypothetical protein